jgi:putative two-component system response regulator
MTTTLDLPSPAETVTPVGENTTSAQQATPLNGQDAIRNSKIAIVDDEPYMIAVVRKHLQDAGYQNVVSTTDSRKALHLFETEEPDLILLDIMMPEISGLDVLRLLRLETKFQHTPVLVLTAAANAQTKKQALELGTTDFLSKPVDPNELLPRICNTLTSKAYHDRLQDRAEELEVLVQKRTAELATAHEDIVHCLARAGEYRDDQTGRHVIRVGLYVGIIARRLGFDDRDVKLLELAAQLHDIGKIAIPDGILSKPGKLDPDEFSLIQRHCGFAKKIMHPLEDADWYKLRQHARNGANLLHVRRSPLLMMAARIAQTHHEWWDGSGYPLGLAGEDIPIEGRITAVADVYDALSTARPYKKAFPRQKCFEIMAAERGTHFEPRILDLFFNSADEIIQVQMDCMDTDS